MPEKKKALFICLGNICRSPMAEAVFIKTLSDLNQADQWEVDSAAIAEWHVGKTPDPRTLDTLQKHGITYGDNRTRQIKTEDFDYFDYIFGMDERNMNDLKERAPKDCHAKLLLLGDFDPKGDKIIRDPYFDSDLEGFEKCYQQALKCSKGFLEHLASENN